jgi:hypothetical protein
MRCINKVSLESRSASLAICFILTSVSTQLAITKEGGDSGPGSALPGLRSKTGNFGTAAFSRPSGDAGSALAPNLALAAHDSDNMAVLDGDIASAEQRLLVGQFTFEKAPLDTAAERCADGTIGADMGCRIYSDPKPCIAQ